MPGGINPPDEVLASWPEPNYVNPVTRGTYIVTMEIVLLCACYLVVALRIWIRIFLLKTAGYDDALIVCTLIPLTGMATALVLALSKYGCNRHIWDIPVDMLYGARKLILTIEFTYTLSTVITKISVLMFYRRLTARISTGFLWAVHISIGLIASSCAATIITMLFGCRPLRAYWLQSNSIWVKENKGKFTCYNESLFIVISATWSMVSDFLVCILPLMLFLKLNMPKRQKFALTIIFGVGFFLCICGILRMLKIIRTYYGTYDITWSAVPIWIWTGIEAHTAVIIASIPALNHFLRNIYRDSSVSSRLRSLASRAYGRNQGGYDRTQSMNSSYDQNMQQRLGMKDNSILVMQEVCWVEERSEEVGDPGQRDVQIHGGWPLADR